MASDHFTASLLSRDASPEMRSPLLRLAPSAGKVTIADADWKADLQRYPPRPFLKEQSVWAIWTYRFGRRTLKMKPGLGKSLRLWSYWLMFRSVEALTGISIDYHAVIGPGLRIHHFGNIFIHGAAVLGANCTLRQGVRIGAVGEEGLAPTIGDNVEFGAYAQVLGDIRIGDNVKISATSLVLSNVPANLSDVGVRIIFRRARAAE